MVKSRKKEKTTFTAREVAVLIEDLMGQFRAFGKGLKALQDKSDTMMGMIAKNSERLTMLGIRFSTMEAEITKINGKLAKIEEDIRVIKTDFGKRLTRLEAIK